MTQKDVADLAGGYEEAGHLLAAGRAPRAIVAGSDEVAFGILRCLREHGLSAPEQVALASIDNIPMAAYAAPPLTTVNVPKIQMGRLAVEVLTNPSQDARATPAATLLPTRLVVRESCGAGAG